MHATNIGNCSIIRLLINANADINLKNKSGETAFMRIPEVTENIEELLDIFISNGANIEDKNNYGLTILMLSTSTNNIKMINELIKRGANINIKDTNDSSLLIMAVKTGNIETVRTILEVGGIGLINNKNIYNKSPLEYAKEQNFIEIVSLLKEYGGTE